MSTTKPNHYNIEDEVLRRYKAGAKQLEQGLCCPANQDYETDYLKALPVEILERDYGCGDPSKHAKPGDTVVDLGSGAGKVCYIISQKVGKAGSVIGVDFNDEMLSLARRHQRDIAAKIGQDNVRFVKGRIQDLALDLDKVQAWLAAHPVRRVDDMSAFEAEQERLRRDEPMIASDSVDLVVSNCVLNLVKPADKMKLFGELFRVLKRNGRAVISDVVCDETPTEKILNDPELWSGCIAGAFREDEFLKMFEEAGFHGIEIIARSDAPWQTIDGIEFRSVTVRAYKGKHGPCLERNQAVIYKGPWKKVVDDDGHTLHRGERMAVCDKTYRLYTDKDGPYAGQMIAVPPMQEIPISEAGLFACAGASRRDPRQTKGQGYAMTISPGEQPCCDTTGCH